MKTLRQTCTATTLSLFLAVSAAAGQIGSGGVVSPPPPPPSEETTTSTTTTIDVTTTVILTILGLIR